MTDEDRFFLRLKEDLTIFAKGCLKIRTKHGLIEPFVFNRAQSYIHQQLELQKGRTGKVRALILKGRQQGCSTYVGGRFFHRTIHNFGTQTFILTHELGATDNLFKMAKRYYENTPELVRPSVSTNNTKELIFGTLDSGYKLGTAENKSVGRSATIQLFHGSEVAFWSNASEHAKGILQAVPDAPGTEIILESTANGVGNYFHQAWQKAEAGLSDFIAIFVPWFWQEEYTREAEPDFTTTQKEEDLIEQYSLSLEQIAWRRYKIIDLSVNGQDGEKSFNQEYPCNAAEAFQLTGEDSFIDSAIVMRARKTIVEPYGPLILGVDPARFGDDRTSFIYRQGRRQFDKVSYVKKDTMEVAGLVHRAYMERRPDKICIDVGGLGAGVVDRCKELIPPGIVVAVNGGESPLNSKKYSNKRSEMWGEYKEWLLETPCQIPDDDSLQADICGIRYKFDSNSRLVMEKKEEMKKRGIRSPDEADAACLTFALPSSAYEIKKDNEVLNSFVQDFQMKQRAIKQSRK
jgi:hypothetical protein